MAHQITAKVTCNSKQEYGTGDNAYATLGFCPDYAQGRNAQWANATPHMDLRMTVRGDVGERFDLGGHYTLTFEREE
jgi:hypothetical protein